MMAGARLIEAAQRETMDADDTFGSDFLLNAATLDFGDAAVDVDVLPRSNDLTELRRKHGAPHVLRAERDEILVAPILVGAPRLSEKNKAVSLRKDSNLACHLWREALLRQMVTRERPLVRGFPKGRLRAGARVDGGALRPRHARRRDWHEGADACNRRYAGLLQLSEDAAGDFPQGWSVERMIAFVWDDAARTEEHATLIQGLEQLERVAGVVLASRPAKRRRGSNPAAGVRKS